jgi:hypothetical protein
LSDSCDIFVDNINVNSRAYDVGQMFLRFGSIAVVQLWPKFDMEDQVSLGVGCVTFKAVEGVRAAFHSVEAITLTVMDWV